MIDVKKLIELVSGDKGLLQELIRLFEEDYPELLLQINKGLDEKDLPKVHYASHRLKGQLRNFFAEDTAKLALLLEEYNLESSAIEARKICEKLNIEIPKIVLELKKLVSSSQMK